MGLTQIGLRRLILSCTAATLAFSTGVLPVGAQPCPGDCNGDREVAVNELISGVNVSLELASIATCPMFDSDNDDTVAVNELIRGVNNLLDSCPAPAACEAGSGRCVEIQPGDGAQDALLTALVEAEPNDVIFVRAGTYELTGQLSLTVDSVTIRGEGMGRTILSFSNQTSGGEGLLVRANRFTIEDIGLENSPGDLLKIEGGNGVTMRRVRAEWTNGPDTENGAYGLYPVQCTDVLIEDSVVAGASDAGVYVGQSRNIIVRRNHVHSNVAGIEIENSTDADVARNLATGNTGGILVFNLPGLPVKDGRRTRIYNNHVIANNTPNFAPEGNIVATVPTGTGTMILAYDQVELFGNTYRDNDTAHAIIVSYNTAEFFGVGEPMDPSFDPFSESIYFTGNTYEGGGATPDSGLNIIVPLVGVPFPNILYDGDEDADKFEEGMLPAALRTCVQEDTVTLVDLDVPNTLANISFELAPFDCSHERLSAVSINPKRTVAISPGPTAQDDLLTALIEAQPGDVITLAAGQYDLTGQLSLSVDDVTIRGAGMEETILSFAGQTTGGEGLLVRADRFVLEDLCLQEGPGDLFKIEGCDGVIVRRVRAEWLGEPDTENGAYGIYPVQCRNVLIEDSAVIGASDAGIYVGQSRNIVVRRNRVEFNVAGIEIENSTDADVYENTATNNTGGILVFNLPGLPVKDGRRTRIFNNQIFENNTPNFAPEGNTVAAVPTGTGSMILANDQVEVFGNTYRDNDTAHAIIISYNTAEFFGIPEPMDPDFDPFSESIYFTDNTYEGGGATPDSGLDIIVPLVGVPFPNILYDGDEDPAKFVEGMLPAGLRTCVQEDTVTLVDLDVPNTLANISFDLAPFDCQHARLTSVAIPGVR